jgi:hypothetical protein
VKTLWLGLLCLAILAGTFQNAGEVDIDRPEEARVIAALFADIARETPQFSIVVAPRSIIVDRSPEELKQALPEASNAVIADLLASSNKPIPVSPVSGLPHGAQITIATAEQLDRIFQSLSPSLSTHRFRREFPEATNLVRLSRVGFDPGSDQAIVYLMAKCGALCGSGNVILLQRSNDGWVRTGFAQLWIS